MIPWKHLSSTTIPGSPNQLHLYQRDQEFSIRVDRLELMNSRRSASEDALSELGCGRIRERRQARVLIGGLGMGYSLRAALMALASDASVVVAELVPTIVTWNQEVFGHLADHPLRDPRVEVRTEDVAKLIGERGHAYDAILLDVDNGPEGLTRKANDRIYSRPGLHAARDALRPGGVFGVWSSAPDTAFTRRLIDCGFETDERTVRARANGKGSRHTIWLATPRPLKPTAARS